MPFKYIFDRYREVPENPSFGTPSVTTAVCILKVFFVFNRELIVDLRGTQKWSKNPLFKKLTIEILKYLDYRLFQQYLALVYQNTITTLKKILVGSSNGMQNDFSYIFGKINTYDKIFLMFLLQNLDP